MGFLFRGGRNKSQPVVVTRTIDTGAEARKAEAEEAARRKVMDAEEARRRAGLVSNILYGTDDDKSRKRKLGD